MRNIHDGGNSDESERNIVHYNSVKYANFPATSNSHLAVKHIKGKWRCLPDSSIFHSVREMPYLITKMLFSKHYVLH